MSGAAPTPVGANGQLRGTRRRQWVATAIAPIVKELIHAVHPKDRSGAIRAHLDKEFGGPLILDLSLEPKSAIVVPGPASVRGVLRLHRQHLDIHNAADVVLYAVRRGIIS